MIDTGPPYINIFQDNVEESGGVISLTHRKKKKDTLEKFHWKLQAGQIQQVIDCIWK